MIGSEVDNEVVLLDIEAGYYYGMNELGSFIWEVIKNDLKVEEVVEEKAKQEQK